MLKIKFQGNMKNYPLALIEAANDIQMLFNSLEANVDQLPVIKFDPLYTKPVNLTSVQIVEGAINQDITVTIKLYTQNWFSYKAAPVNAHVKPEDPDSIYFNTRMFKGWGKDAHDYSVTILHELVHVFDHHSPYVFWHGDNKLKGKDETAPVKLANHLYSLMLSIKADNQPLIW